MVKKFASFAGVAALTLGFGSAFAQGPATTTSANPEQLTSFLNQVAQINSEEQSMAKLASSKAGDNQAMATMAETIKGDHAANENALKALANQKNVKLDTSEPSEEKSERKQMKSLSGAAFNEAYLNGEIEDHNKAIEQLRQAQSQFKGDRDVQLYIGQTLPVMEAHLKMAENMRKGMAAGSTENPENNKSTTNSGGAINKE